VISAAVLSVTLILAAAAPAAGMQARGDAPQAGDFATDLALARRAVAEKPRSADAWWRLATLLYDHDRFGGAAAGFENVVSIDPNAGTAWVMLGLCEFRLGRFDRSLGHIQRGQRIGTNEDPQFQHVMHFHEGVLLLRRREFERAQDALASVTRDGVDSDDVIIALGQSVLRLTPSDLPAPDSPGREMVRRAGRAAALTSRHQFGEAEAAYEKLASDFPGTRNIHYAVGRYFADTSQPERAAAAYAAEIQVSPDHVPARLGLAAIEAESDPAAALRLAEQAVSLNARIPLGHYLLGVLLLEANHVSRAIAELNVARQAVPEDPEIYYALGRAYTRANRPADAARARATFKHLTERAQRAAERSRPSAEPVSSPPSP
jgi:tetratricopeptide (TPR) repeat protein